MLVSEVLDAALQAWAAEQRWRQLRSVTCVSPVTEVGRTVL